MTQAVPVGQLQRGRSMGCNKRQRFSKAAASLVIKSSNYSSINTQTYLFKFDGGGGIPLDTPLGGKTPGNLGSTPGCNKKPPKSNNELHIQNLNNVKYSPAEVWVERLQVSLLGRHFGMGSPRAHLQRQVGEGQILVGNLGFQGLGAFHWHVGLRFHSG